MLEQKYDSNIVEAAMQNSKFIDSTLQRFDKIMSNDDSWVSALECAIERNINLVSEISNSNEVSMKEQISKARQQAQQINAQQKQVARPTKTRVK